MCKKIFCTIIIFTIMLIFSIPAMAYPDIDASVTGGILNNSLTDIVQTGQQGVEDEKEEDPFEQLLVKFVEDPDIEKTEQFLVEIQINKQNRIPSLTCSLKSDVAEEKNVWLMLAIYNKEKNIYEEYKNTSGVGRWNIGESGVFFLQGFQLKTGKYQLKIIVFKKPLNEILNKNEVNEYLNSFYENPFTDTGDMEINNINSYNESSIEKLKSQLGKNIQVSYDEIDVLDEATTQKLVKNDPKVMDTENVVKRILDEK